MVSASASHASDATITRIEPSKGWVPLKLRELWAYRELLYFLVWRDIKVRYKQTALGAAWAIIQPFMTMVVMNLFFGKLAGLGPKDVPYPIWNFAALVPWTFFAGGLALASNSLVGSSNLIRKVYFPRLTLPIATILAGLVDFALAFGVLLLMMPYFKRVPTWNIVWLPAFLLLALITALGVGLWLSALNVKYRDVRYIVSFLTSFWMFATPISYSIDIVPEKWRAMYGLNPMVGVVEGFRWAMLGTENIPLATIATSALAALAILVSGAFYFRRTEKMFADLV